MGTYFQAMVSIRSLTFDDRDELINLWHNGWHDAHANIVPEGVLRYRTLECFEEWFRGSADQFHVAVDNGVLGFVSMQGSEIVKLYVDPTARGAGIASKLLFHGERELYNEGVTDGVLLCTAGNARAQRFYNREGWILSETFPDRLWLPDGVSEEYFVDTHRYEKKLN
mgnify:CR=1 FL=1